MMFREDDYATFDGSAYLKTYYSEESSLRLSMLRYSHEAFKSLPDGLSYLDFGCGPSLHLTITAATKASEIVLCDYSESNRKTLRRWLDKEPDAYNWSSYFSYVVQELEGKGPEEVEKRQDLVRQRVKAVVHCDITQDPPIEKGYNKQYDVVMTSLCLSATSRTPEDFRNGIARLGKLVKPGGILMEYDSERESVRQRLYHVGDAEFLALDVTRDFAKTAIIDAGFTNVHVQKASDSVLRKELGEDNTRSTVPISFFFLQGTRK